MSEVISLNNSNFTELNYFDTIMIDGGTDWWLLGSGLIAAAICVGVAIAQPEVLVTPKYWAAAGTAVTAIVVGLNN